MLENGSNFKKKRRVGFLVNEMNNKKKREIEKK